MVAAGSADDASSKVQQATRAAVSRPPLSFCPYETAREMTTLATAIPERWFELAALVSQAMSGCKIPGGGGGDEWWAASEDTMEPEL